MTAAAAAAVSSLSGGGMCPGNTAALPPRRPSSPENTTLYSCRLCSLFLTPIPQARTHSHTCLRARTHAHPHTRPGGLGGIAKLYCCRVKCVEPLMLDQVLSSPTLRGCKFTTTSGRSCAHMALHLTGPILQPVRPYLSSQTPVEKPGRINHRNKTLLDLGETIFSPLFTAQGQTAASVNP